MALWYAIYCNRDRLDKSGKVEYPAGSVCSYGTSPPSVAQLAEIGCEAIAIGEYANGPDFSKERFDLTLKQMIPYVEPKTAAELLLEKTSWNTADRDAAMRILLLGR